MGPWDALRAILFEDTAGNISRILGYPQDWAEEFRNRYGGIAFTVAKYARFAMKERRPKNLGPLTKDGWRDLLWDADDLDMQDDRFKDASFKDMLRVLKMNPALASKLNGARDVVDFSSRLTSIIGDFKKKMTGRTFIEFPDGWRWIGLGSGRSSEEGQMMQHCGAASTTDGELFSLRDPSGNPHVTIEYNERKNTIYQMRGKQNSRPDPKYGKYITAFIEKTKAKIYSQED